MKKFGKMGLLAMIVLLPACGGQDQGPGTEKAYDHGTLNCSEQFLDDYNDWIRANQRMNSDIRAMSSRPTVSDDATLKADTQVAQSKALGLQRGYRDVVCVASVDGVAQSIDLNAQLAEDLPKYERILGRIAAEVPGLSDTVRDSVEVERLEE